MEKQAAQQILTAGYLAGYINKEAGALTNALKGALPNKYNWPGYTILPTAMGGGFAAGAYLGEGDPLAALGGMAAGGLVGIPLTVYAQMAILKKQSRKEYKEMSKDKKEGTLDPKLNASLDYLHKNRGEFTKEAADKENILTRFFKKKPKGTLFEEMTRPTPSLMGEIFKPRKNAGKDMLAEILKKGLKKTPAKVVTKATENIVKK